MVAVSQCKEAVTKSPETYLEDAFRLLSWFHKSFNGFETKRWNLVALMDLGGPMLQQGPRDKLTLSVPTSPSALKSSWNPPVRINMI